jgi:hypothetical protein
MWTVSATAATRCGKLADVAAEGNDRSSSKFKALVTALVLIAVAAAYTS